MGPLGALAWPLGVEPKISGWVTEVPVWPLGIAAPLGDCLARSHGFPWVPLGSPRFPMVPRRSPAVPHAVPHAVPYGSPWSPSIPTRFTTVPFDSHGAPRFPLGPLGSLGSHRYPLGSPLRFPFGPLDSRFSFHFPLVPPRFPQVPLAPPPGFPAAPGCPSVPLASQTLQNKRVNSFNRYRKIPNRRKRVGGHPDGQTRKPEVRMN